MMKLGQKTSQEADDRKVAAASCAASREVAWTLHYVDHIDHVDHVDDGDHVDRVAFVDGDDGDDGDDVDSDDGDVGDFFSLFQRIFLSLCISILCISLSSYIVKVGWPGALVVVSVIILNEEQPGDQMIKAIKIRITNTLCQGWLTSCTGCGQFVAV